jgi:hypothetical protein
MKNKNNGAFFDPSDSSLVVSAWPKDIRIMNDDSGMIHIMVENLSDGIEIVHESEDIWWPIKEK